jgi:hypothetical protein
VVGQLETLQKTVLHIKNSIVIYEPLLSSLMNFGVSKYWFEVRSLSIHFLLFDADYSFMISLIKKVSHSLSLSNLSSTISFILSITKIDMRKHLIFITKLICAIFYQIWITMNFLTRLWVRLTWKAIWKLKVKIRAFRKRKRKTQADW